MLGRYTPSHLIRTGLRRGLLGGHWGWRTVLVVALVGRVLARAVKRGPGPVVHSERLPVGGGLEIRHSPTSPASGG
jgi:hypothetical protein